MCCTMDRVLSKPSGHELVETVVPSLKCTAPVTMLTFGITHAVWVGAWAAQSKPW